MAFSNVAGPQEKTKSNPGLLALLLALVLAVLFFRSFQPDEVVFSNDAPLGGLSAALNRVPAVFTGAWHDLNWIGTQSPTPPPTFTGALRLITTPVGFSKWFYPYTLFILGLSAWYCFRRLKLAPLACVLGGLAAALSSHFLSTACWGVASQVICVAMSFAAVGLLASTCGASAPAGKEMAISKGSSGTSSPLPSPPREPQSSILNPQSTSSWVRVVLAGMAVGMGVMEGYDIGALFSLYVAAFVVYQAWITTEGAPPKKIFHGVLRAGVVAVFAGFIATQAVTVLIGTQIKGVAGMEQDAESKAKRWDEATRWSLPPGEVLQIPVAGLFGYRMDTPKDMAAFGSLFEGGTYWGQIGRGPEMDVALSKWQAAGKPEPRLQGGFRFSGGGEYAGLLVVVVVIWTVVQSLRRKDSVFSVVQRRFIWFWAAAAFVSLLLAFGRHAPFFRIFYSLPYASTIRNATKFTHPFHWSLVILFAYGIHGLSSRYLSSATATTFKAWWAKAAAFDKRWIKASVAAVAVSFLGMLVYSSSKPKLVEHLQDVGFGDPRVDPQVAEQIASFSIHSLAWTVLLLAIVVGLLTLVISGWFGGKRARLGGILLGGLLVLDLARANLPWILYWNYKEKYATNPVVEFLRDKPYEHRVAVFPLERFIQFDRLPREAQALAGMYQQLHGVYSIEWSQHHFQYYNIQSLDVIQMPRQPVDYLAFETAMVRAPVRRWELTNTRYLLAPAGLLDFFNQQVDPGQHRFQIAERFDIVPKPGQTELRSYDQFTAVANTNGQYAVFSFNGALPRAKLYTNWQVSTNDQTTLDTLASPSFDPEKSVFVASPLTVQPAATTNAASSGGSVDFVSYAPKRLVLQAKASAPSVLLLNDKFDPSWKVTVDGKPERVLRCNYLMRGVQVPAGEHKVEFRFEPPITGLYVSLAAIGLGLVLIGFLAVKPEGERRD